jgi:glycerol-3-phosphate acyltransferase PlsX
LSADDPRIAIDAMGGDNAPDAIVAGACSAARRLECRIALVGDEAKVRALVEKHGAPVNVECIHTGEVVSMDESPAAAVRRGAVTSMGKALDLVRDGSADAAFSAGNSGAFLAIATIRLRPLPGLARPAIATVWPAKKGPMLVLDAGANVDCKPEWIAQFAVMGSAYARAVLGIEHPKVGLLSIGEEEGKGNALVDAATPLLANAPISFAGNVEGRDMLLGEVDVIVCDGFVGNVALKLAEGAGEYVFGALKEAANSSFLAGVGAALLRGKIREIRARMDYREYGGAPLLGINGICLIGHGRTDPRAVESACKAALRAVKQDLVGSIARALAAGGRTAQPS